MATMMIMTIIILTILTMMMMMLSACEVLNPGSFTAELEHAGFLKTDLMLTGPEANPWQRCPLTCYPAEPIAAD